MPLSYTIDPDRGIADVLAVGTVTLDETLKVIRAIAADLSHHQCGCITDVREMDYFPSVSDLKEIAFEFIRLRAAFRCGIAFVVESDRHYALGRLLSALVDSAGLRVGVFRDPDEAEAWLKNLSDVHFGRVTS